MGTCTVALAMGHRITLRRARRASSDLPLEVSLVPGRNEGVSREFIEAWIAEHENSHLGVFVSIVGEPVPLDPPEEPAKVEKPARVRRERA